MGEPGFQFASALRLPSSSFHLCLSLEGPDLFLSWDEGRCDRDRASRALEYFDQARGSDVVVVSADGLEIKVCYIDPLS